MARPLTMAHPSPDSWPTFHGDYSGRHYSALDQINKTNVKSLSLAWTSRLNPSLQGAIIGGKGPDPAPGAVPNANVKATPLVVNGMLYLATPNNAYATWASPCPHPGRTRPTACAPCVRATWST